MKKSNVYVASSWRNDYQHAVVELIKSQGHEVYDFKNPPNQSGFSWAEIDPDWQNWTPKKFASVFDHPRVVGGFRSDYEALYKCNVCVIVLPCGRSAHLEAGYAAGMDKHTVAYIPKGTAFEPELMYGLFNAILTESKELNDYFKIE